MIALPSLLEHALQKLIGYLPARQSLDGPVRPPFGRCIICVIDGVEPVLLAAGPIGLPLREGPKVAVGRVAGWDDDTRGEKREE